MPGHAEYIRVDLLAKKLGTQVPADIGRDFWSLPLLEKLIARIEELENAVKKNEPDRISGFDVAGLLGRDGS